MDCSVYVIQLLTLTQLCWWFGDLDAQVSQCRIYCRMSTNWRFKFVWVTIPWSFLVILAMTMTMTINSNSVLLVRVASAGQYESFEHVQIFRLTSTNNFHSCLCALKTFSYHLCHTACMLYSSRSYCIPGCSNYILLHSYLTVRLGHHQKTLRNKMNGARMC